MYKTSANDDRNRANAQAVMSNLAQIRNHLAMTKKQKEALISSMKKNSSLKAINEIRREIAPSMQSKTSWSNFDKAQNKKIQSQYVTRSKLRKEDKLSSTGSRTMLKIKF